MMTIPDRFIKRFGKVLIYLCPVGDDEMNVDIAELIKKEIKRNNRQGIKSMAIIYINGPAEDVVTSSFNGTYHRIDTFPTLKDYTYRTLRHWRTIDPSLLTVEILEAIQSDDYEISCKNPV